MRRGRVVRHRLVVTPPPRPTRRFDEGLQHERTALAWERTAVAIMAAGVLFARFAAHETVPAIALVGVLQTLVGAAVLVWAGRHYEDLHGPLRAGADVVHPTAARLVGGATIVFIGFSFAVAVHHALS